MAETPSSGKHAMIRPRNHTQRGAGGQVAFRGFILRNKYDTSYICLARRAAKSNNIWNRLVRKGSSLRRVCMYGGSPQSTTHSDLAFVWMVEHPFKPQKCPQVHCRGRVGHGTGMTCSAKPARWHHPLARPQAVHGDPAA